MTDLPDRLEEAAQWSMYQWSPAPDWEALLEEAAAALRALEADLRHWRTNHDEQVRRKHAAREAGDLARSERDQVPTLAEIADEMRMLPAEALSALNAETAYWRLGVGRHGLTVRFNVGGEVYPLRPGGTRAKRGKRPFFGDHSVDATKALYLGLKAAREVAER